MILAISLRWVSDQHLVEFYKGGLISLEDTLSTATSPHEFKLLLTKATGRGY